LGGGRGGRALEGELEALKEALYNYYGALNEVKAGIVKVSLPDKPQALIRFEQCQALNVQLLSGGLLGQPHIWLLEVAIIRDTQSLFAGLQNTKSE